MNPEFDIVILGLSITSSWGNGHATTYRSLVRGLNVLNHRVLFLERDMEWYASNRDDGQPSGACTKLYSDLDELINVFEKPVSKAALVIVGSYVPDGLRVGEWALSVAKGTTAFYDIDTPVTLAALRAGQNTYVSPELIRRYDIYLSFTGGPTLRLIESQYGSPMARALYCSVNPEHYHPERLSCDWDLGYLGTYSSDRQPALEELLIEPARRNPSARFNVVGPMYPDEIRWPANVARNNHMSPAEHVRFYNAQRFTLNITRHEMKKAGYSPSVRLFEAGACGVPLISDWWEGLDSIFVPGKEILIASNADDTLRYLSDLPDSKRLAIASAARERVLSEHTSEKRAAQLKSYWGEAIRA